MLYHCLGITEPETTMNRNNNFQRRPPLLPNHHLHHSNQHVPQHLKIPTQMQLDYDRRRKVALKCLELEEALMNQGYAKFLDSSLIFNCKIRAWNITLKCMDCYLID